MISKNLIVEEITKRISEEKILLSKQWNNNDNYTKFFFIDNLLDEEVVNRIYNSFPFQVGLKLNQFNSFREKKKTFAKIDQLDHIIPNCTDAFHDEKVIKAISEITGIDNLTADPSLYAGGLSMMGKGDFLNPHIDNSHDSGRTMYRRLNLLYYVTPDWSLESGGNLELWNRRVSNNITIHSKFNRLVVMNTNEHSWHSVNEVKIDNLRCCLSNYYFSPISPNGKNYYHVTSFNGRPGQTTKRIYSIFDNFIRQQIAHKLKISRGSKFKRKN